MKIGIILLIVGLLLIIYNLFWGGFLWMLLGLVIAVIGFSIMKLSNGATNNESTHVKTGSNGKSNNSSHAYSSNYGVDVKFPEHDEYSNKLSKVYKNIRLSGTARINDHVRTQTVIKRIKNDDLGIKLIHKEIDGYPLATAVIVDDSTGNMAGWIPEMFHYHDDIGEWVKNGDSVKAGIRIIDGGGEGEHFGITIDIAKYENVKE